MFAIVDFPGLSTLDVKAPRKFPIAFKKDTFKSGNGFRVYANNSKFTHSVWAVWMKNGSRTPGEVQFGHLRWDSDHKFETLDEMLASVSRKDARSEATVILHPKKVWIGSQSNQLELLQECLEIRNRMEKGGKIDETWTDWFISA